MLFIPYRTTLVFILFLHLSVWLFAQDMAHTSPGAGNPVIPGYFADPTVRKFGDTYYIYATTDGNGFGFGPSQVWTSKDFVNWGIQPMNWPHTPIYWAPDVNQAADGNYYLYYCQPVEIYGAKSASPTGPWTPLLPDGKPMIPNYFVPDVITLDGQTFRDDDGKMYMFWGTWGIYPNSGCGMGQLNPDMKTFAKTGKIPNTIAKDFFEAPVMFKRNGIYYLLYSAEHCEDETYKVHYVMSKEGPMGPFTYGQNSPILVTNADGTVHGPGHNSVLQEGEDYYIVYHRHNNPHNQGGFHRQVAADKLAFDSDGNILPVVPTHKGIGALAKNTIPYTNLAWGKTVKASSHYSTDFIPEFAVDDNNGTLWKAADNMHDAWLEVDLGKKQTVRSILTQFEYATWFYQYRILYSENGKDWKVFADRWENTRFGSPMKDYGEVQARYIKWEIGDTQIGGLNKAIWNVKVFAEPQVGKDLGQYSEEQETSPKSRPQGLLVAMQTEGYEIGQELASWKNVGALGGELQRTGTHAPYVIQLAGRKALWFDGQTSLTSSFDLPGTLTGNSSFTVALWAYNPEIGKREILVNWANGNRDLMHASLGYGTDRAEGGAVHGGWGNLSYNRLPREKEWHHIVLTFDGTSERLYVDGQIEREGIHRMLFLKEVNKLIVGNDGNGRSPFSGAISDLKIYDSCLTGGEVSTLAKQVEDNPFAVYLKAADYNYTSYQSLAHQGYLKGELKTAGTTQINDSGGIISLILPAGVDLVGDKALLDTLENRAEFTFLAYINPSKSIKPLLPRANEWQQVAIIKNKGQWHYYLNGEEKPIKSRVAQFIGLRGLLLDGKAKASLALSELSIIDKAYNNIQIKDDYEKWKKLHQVSWPQLQFSTQSRATSPYTAYLEADEQGTSLGKFRYLFVLNDSLFGTWSEKPWEFRDQLRAGASYRAAYKLSDRYGNVSPYSSPLELSIAEDSFGLFKDDFFGEGDWESKGWTGLEGLTGDSAQVEVVEEGLKLASAKTAWDGQGTKGPFLYKEVAGDFLVEVQLADMSGLKNRRAMGANEVGLMARLFPEEKTPESLLQNGVMLGWGVGNIVTDLRNGRRMQQALNSGWDFYPYLQLQRVGKLFFVRGSRDGKQWQELPGSPYVRPDMEGKSLQIGIYHSRYGDDIGYGVFKDFRLYQ